MSGVLLFSPALKNTAASVTVKIKWSWLSCGGSGNGVTQGRTAHPADEAHATSTLSCPTAHTPGLHLLNLGKLTWTPAAQVTNTFTMAAGMRLFGATPPWPRPFHGTFTGGHGPAAGAYSGTFRDGTQTGTCGGGGVSLLNISGKVSFNS